MWQQPETRNENSQAIFVPGFKVRQKIKYNRILCGVSWPAFRELPFAGVHLYMRWSKNQGKDFSVLRGIGKEAR